MLDVDPDVIDVVEFERLAAWGVEAFREGRPDLASPLLQSALELWSGDALTGVMDAPFVDGEVARLDLRRRTVLQARIDADLALGLGATLVPELRGLVDADPYDERTCERLMTALYRAGHPVAALEAFRRLREALRDDLGLQPGPELVEVERKILVHDDGLLGRTGTTAGRAGNLPLEVTSFIGRRREVADLHDLVSRSRLTTVTGPGGAGKTRLAVAVARSLQGEVDHGVWMVELAALTDGGQIASRLAESLGVRAGGVDELVDALIPWSTLILLDNCEHVVVAAAELVARLLRGCPHVRILTTSREPLGVGGERIYRVPPLAHTRDPMTPANEDGDAIELFVQRAALQRHDFVADGRTLSIVSEICRRLDGLPLAIELAAARIGTLPLEELAHRLKHRLTLFDRATRRPVGRQQTLRALIDWSYDLLEPEEQRTFAMLSVFANGFTIPAAEAIHAVVAIEDDALPHLESLVAKSLVEMIDVANGRYRLLEAVREYATEKLCRTPTLEHDMTRAHAHYYLALAEAAQDALLNGPEQAEWLDRLAIEEDNLRSAAATFANTGCYDHGLRLVRLLLPFWELRGDGRDGVAIAIGLVENAPDDLASGRGWALCTAARLEECSGQSGHALALAEQAASIAVELDDRELLAASVVTISNCYCSSGEHDAALRRTDALDLAGVSYSTASRVHRARAYAHAASGDHRAARALYRELAEVARASGDDRQLCGCLVNLACADIQEGHHEAAIARLHDVLARNSLAPDDVLAALIHENLGLIALVAGEVAAAHLQYRQAALCCVPSRDRLVTASCVLGLAMCANTDPISLEVAARLHGAVDHFTNDGAASNDQVEFELRAKHRDDLKRHLGEGRFNALLQEGHSLDIGAALETAKTLSSPTVPTRTDTARRDEHPGTSDPPHVRP